MLYEKENLLVFMKNKLGVVPSFKNTPTHDKGNQIDWCFSNLYERTSETQIKATLKSQVYESWFTDHKPIWNSICFDRILEKKSNENIIEDFDYNQKTISQKNSGDRELVSIIKYKNHSPMETDEIGSKTFKEESITDGTEIPNFNIIQHEKLKNEISTIYKINNETNIIPMEIDQSNFIKPQTTTVSENSTDKFLKLIEECFPNNRLWGGNIKNGLNNILENQSKYTDFTIINTCTVDYFLLALWLTSKLSKKIAKYFRIQFEVNTKEYLLSAIIKCIDMKDWNLAKSIWILKFLEYSPVNGVFNTYGDEFTTFYSRLICFQTIIYTCKNCKSSKRKIFNHTIRKNDDNSIEYSILKPLICKHCQQARNGSFENNPFWLFFEVYPPTNSITMMDLKSELHVNGNNFKLLMSTIHQIGHFTSVFKDNQKYFIVDDLKDYSNTVLELNTISNHKIKTVLYFLA